MPTLSAEKRFTQSRLSQTILASWIMQILFVSSEKVKSIKVVRNDCIGPSHRDFYSEKNCTYEDYVLSLRRTDAIRTRFVPATHDGPCATALPTFGTVSPSHQRRWEMLPGCPTPRPVLHRGGLSVGPPPTENVDHVTPGQEKKKSDCTGQKGLSGFDSQLPSPCFLQHAFFGRPIFCPQNTAGASKNLSRKTGPGPI